MQTKLIVLLSTIFFLVSACKNTSSGEKSKVKTDNWTEEQFIVSCPESLKPEVIQLVEYTRKEWKSIPNPFIAKYTGNGFGDYHHINFQDAAEHIFDFGSANNDFGDYVLFDEETLDDNLDYLDKTFKVYWTWKASKFPCCSGGYESVEVYMPSISKLKLLE